MDHQTTKGWHSGLRGERAVVLILLMLVIPIYAWRLSCGVGLGDEGYYALYPVAWLRSTPSETGILHLHQFAGTITFPLVKLYSCVRPDFTGLILALRIAFGLAALGVTILLYRLLALVLPHIEAAACSGMILLFIPFGIPTLSYNTLGMLGMIGGIAVVGKRVLDVVLGFSLSQTTLMTKDWGVAIAGGMMFVVASLAYPTLVVLPLLIFLMLAVEFPSQRRLVMLSAAMFGVIGVIGLASSVVFLGGPERIKRILEFSFRMDNSLGMNQKIRLGIQMLSSNSTYIVICISGVGLGILRSVLHFPVVRSIHFITIAMLATKIVFFMKTPAVLCTPGHDLIFFLTLAGLPTLVVPGRNRDHATKMFSILFIVGICGGMLNAYTATLSMFNFCLLGVLATVAGMGSWVYKQPLQVDFVSRIVGPAWCITLTFLIGWSSATFIYGETGCSLATLRCFINHGPYAGLQTGLENATLIGEFEELVKPYDGISKTVDVCGPLPGLYLLTPFQFRSPMPYILEDHRSKRTYDLLVNHYLKAGNCPDLFVWVQNYQLKLNQVQEQLLQTDYQEIKRANTLVVYLRRSASPTSEKVLRTKFTGLSRFPGQP